MDFGNATLLTFVLVALVEIIKLCVPITFERWQMGLLLLAAGQVDVALVAHSDWGVKQVIDGFPLNTMNAGSLALVGLALTAFGLLTYKLIDKAIPNIGQNLPPDPQ